LPSLLRNHFAQEKKSSTKI